MSRSLCHALLVPIPGMLKCQRTLLGRQSWLKRRCETLSSSGSSALPLAFPQECEGAGTGSPELQWAGALTSGRRKKPVLLAQGSVRGAWCLRGTLAVPSHSFVSASASSSSRGIRRWLLGPSAPIQRQEGSREVCGTSQGYWTTNHQIPHGLFSLPHSHTGAG